MMRSRVYLGEVRSGPYVRQNAHTPLTDPATPELTPATSPFRRSWRSPLTPSFHCCLVAPGTQNSAVTTGKPCSPRLDQGGNRQINAALHRIVVTRARCHQPTRDYIARRRSEGKSTREAIRCLKRHLVRRVWRLLQPPHPTKTSPSTLNSLT
jgi:hypothetical protein